MPYRSLVTKELADLFGVLSHPLRIRIVEELHGGEKDVNSLAQILGISHSGVSQHLALLRVHKVIIERREGRNVFYRLRHEGLASWALDGLRFAGLDLGDAEQFHSAVEKARVVWSDKAAEGA